MKIAAIVCSFSPVTVAIAAEEKLAVVQGPAVKVPSIQMERGCSAPKLVNADDTNLREKEAQIRNVDLDFDDEYPGILEYIGGPSEEVRKSAAGPPLFLRGFEGPKAVYCCHVLLTHQASRKRVLSAKDWNHLVIDRFGSANDRNVKDQRTAIGRFWSEQLSLKKWPDGI